MTDFLRTRPSTTDAMAAVFADDTTLRYALAFEAELARAEAAEGLIKQSDADEIVKACESISIKPDELAAEAAFAGTLAIPLLKHLRITVQNILGGDRGSQPDAVDGIDDLGTPSIRAQHAHDAIGVHALAHAGARPALPVVGTHHDALTDGADQNVPFTRHGPLRFTS